VLQLYGEVKIFVNVVYMRWPGLASGALGPNYTWLVTSRLDTTRSTCLASRDERVECVEPCCSNMADDEQAILLACTSLVVFMLLRTN